MTLNINSTITLNNGVEMPRLGFGLWQVSGGKQGRRVMHWALEAGYRHFDGATLYGNEAELGEVLRQSALPRKEIFVTTKLWNSDHGYEQTLRAFDASMDRLGLEQVDLYLIHWPVGSQRNDSWRALLKLYDEGRCRAIGVSNYNINHLQELLAESPLVPAVNQVEFSPFLYQTDLLAFCREHGIQLEAYSPLAKGTKFGDKGLKAVAAKYGKSPAQILIRWALQHDLVVIPKSSNKGRIHENADVFDFVISDKDVAALDAFSAGYRSAWDPTDEA